MREIIEIPVGDVPPRTCLSIVAAADGEVLEKVYACVDCTFETSDLVAMLEHQRNQAGYHTLWQRVKRWFGRGRTMSIIGPTGEPPITKDPHDKGGLNAALSIQDGLIRLEFGTSVTFVAMTAQEAEGFARELLKKAEKLKSKEGE